MSYYTPHVIAATSVVVALVLLQVCDVSSVVCDPCYPDLECPTLPDDCEPAYRLCRCCPECKGKVGATCKTYGLPCESGLMCVNKYGVAMAVISQFDPGFRGVCREVQMCQLLTQPWWAIGSEGEGEGTETLEDRNVD